MTEDERQLRHLLVEMSREGPVDLWLTRMANLLDGSGIKRENINWSGPPSHVAHGIVMEARKLSKADDLLYLLQKRQVQDAF